MSEPNETVEEPKARFTEIRQFVAGDRFIGFASCLECGAGVFIDSEDRKNDVHPMAIHIGWHDELGETLDEVEAFTDATAEVLKNVVGGNKAEFMQEVTDSGRQVQRTKNVQERREGGTNRPQGPRPGPAPRQD